MATHSSILAWEMPWTEEPFELQSVESQKSRTRLNDLTTEPQKTPPGAPASVSAVLLLPPAGLTLGLGTF